MDHVFDETQPIYVQIMQRLCAQILRGDYRPGDKLPSVIDAAIHFKVNHNTLARVYLELARQGIVETKRGEGTFVTEDRQVLEALHHAMRDSLLENFFTEMARLGYSTEEILTAMRAYIEKVRSKQSTKVEEVD